MDAVGHNATVDTAFAAVRSTGTVSVVGIHDLEPYPLALLMGTFRSITLRMTTAPVHRTWGELLPLIADGRLDTTGIFTHTFDLDDAAEAGELLRLESALGGVIDRVADVGVLNGLAGLQGRPAPGYVDHGGLRLDGHALLLNPQVSERG